MSDRFTVIGAIGADLERRTTSKGDPYARFRIASTERRRDDDGNWTDAATSWYDVSVYGALGQNALDSLGKGQRVVVHGDLTIREYTTQDGRRGNAASIRASALGHDLMFGTSSFSRVKRDAPRREATPGPAPAPTAAQVPVDRSGEWPEPMAPGSGELVSAGFGEADDAPF